MTPDALRAVSGHEADDNGARHRHKNNDHTQMSASRRDKSSAPSQIEEEIGEKADESQQGQGDEGAENADPDRYKGDRDNAPRRGKVAERTRWLPVSQPHSGRFGHSRGRPVEPSSALPAPRYDLR